MAMDRALYTARFWLSPSGTLIDTHDRSWNAQIPS